MKNKELWRELFTSNYKYGWLTKSLLKIVIIREREKCNTCFNIELKDLVFTFF